MSIIPKSKPKLTLSQVRAILASQGVTSPVAILGVRGYYSESMGKPGNDRNIYDDAMFVVGPQAFASFNANTDPSVFRRGIATMKVGVHWYKKGWHGLSWKKPRQPYRALRPATKGEKVPVTRDGIAAENTWLGTALNIHCGGNNGTYSEGCQTLPPSQYWALYNLVDAEMRRSSLDVVPYVLIDVSELEKMTKAVPASSADVLEVVLRKQMERDKSLVQMLLTGAAKYQLAPAFVLAIASRETGIVNDYGDGGHGRGVMQIDARFHPIAVTTDFFKAPTVLINYGCAMLEDDLLWAKRTWPKYTDAQHLKIAAASYNSGRGGAKKGALAGDADKFTAHQNYGADVLKRMAVFEKLLGERE